MTTFTEFVEREIEPTLGGYVDCYDTEGIAEKVSDFDECEGYVWKPEYEEGEPYWKLIEKYAIK